GKLLQPRADHRMAGVRVRPAQDECSGKTIERREQFVDFLARIAFTKRGRVIRHDDHWWMKPDAKGFGQDGAFDARVLVDQIESRIARRGDAPRFLAHLTETYRMLGQRDEVKVTRLR